MKKKSKRINKYKYLDTNIRIDKIIEKRYKILIVLIILLMSILITKLVLVQIVDHEKYSSNLEELTFFLSITVILY